MIIFMINNRKDVEKAGIYILELDGADDMIPISFMAIRKRIMLLKKNANQKPKR